LRKKRVAILSALFIATVAAGAWVFFFWLAPRTSGPLRHDVYVWQRAWTKPVRDAVTQHATNFAELAVLKAEISWKTNRQPQLARANVDYETLAQAGRPVGITLRIGSYAGPFLPPGDSGLRGQAQRDPALATTAQGTNGSKAPSSLRSAGAVQDTSVTDYLCNVAAGIVNEARTNRVPLAELQIDFDSAESKLEGYRIWVEAIQRRVAPLPVTITALPSWLDSRAFQRLAAVATNYVLQVHSVERPKSFTAPFTLCDPRAARRAVERAGRIGVPFRVALPTYGYLLAYDANGKFISLSAEGPRPNWPTNAQLREVSSDAVALAELVQTWTADRPAAMRGVIWYRLPTIVDNFNWRWPTLGAILAARIPQEKFSVNLRRVESGLVEISLANAGELDVSSRLAVEVRWSKARLIAGDALRDFELVDRQTATARFQTKSQPVRVRAGDQRVLGWLRFDQDCEVQGELKKL
jgi:hypothetical protein